MAKRKQPSDRASDAADSPSKRQRTTSSSHKLTNGVHARDQVADGSPVKSNTPSRRKRKTAADVLLDDNDDNEEGDDVGSPTPKANGRPLFSTPTKNKPKARSTPSKSTKADRSAKRKSARLLAETQDEDDWDGQGALAKEILEEEEADEDEVEQTVEVTEGEDTTTATTPVKTPGKRGRPKGAKNKRSPTPEGDIPPEERYFFQNRGGPPQVSSNKFTSVKLLTHDEYLAEVSSWTDPHEAERARLMKLHERSFAQWQFELAEGFSPCLYGYGSKRQLVTRFAEWMHRRHWQRSPPRIVVVNGYTPRPNVRGILNTIASVAVAGDDDDDERPSSTLRLTGPPQEMLDTLLAHLTDHPRSSGIVVLVNSIDAPALRRAGVQSIFARLAAHPHVQLLATADSPTFASLWNSSVLDQFRFAFHDCTTFAPYTAEIGSVVDEVHDLLGRRRTRGGGKDGVGFVLKSLPENARNLYRLLLTELLNALSMDDTCDHDEAPVPAGGAASRGKSARTEPANVDDAAAAGVEYRTLYQKASEEFICSSAMNFQFLLKEFHDHQMITSRRDASGTEVLGVPLGRDEMEAVLEELV